jgi:2-oxoglutarate ferredoxin oxidoreductase subunit alpha
VEFQVLIAGEAGQGIAKSAELVAKDFVSRGFYVFNYRDYGSLIKGGENFNLLRISDRPVFSNNWKSDFAVIFGRFSAHQISNLVENGISIGTIEGVHSRIDTGKILSELGAPKIVENSVLIGSLYKSLGQPLDGLLKQMACFGKNAEVNRNAAMKGYQAYTGKVNAVQGLARKSKKYYLSGSDAVAKGAVASGMDLYLAYPMTPATPVLHLLAEMDGETRAIQLENEIGIINAGLGASFAGATVMVGTSGGGYALMTEAASLQGISEIPLVVYMCMRPGPATGVPTYTGQGDLKFMLNSGHGEFPKVVVAPGDPLEAFERVAECFYLSNKYRTLSMILTDKHIAESQFTLESQPKLRVNPRRFIVNAKGEFRNYKINPDGVSPRGIPGDAIVRATSYEHDEMGYTAESSEGVNKMVEKRLAKAKTIEEAVMKLEPVSVHGKGRNLVIGWGSTKGAIIDAMAEVPDTKFLQIIYLKPFPSKEVKKEIESSSRAVIVENSATGQISDVIRENTGIEVNRKILKYDGRPFGKDELVKKLREAFK